MGSPRLVLGCSSGHWGSKPSKCILYWIQDSSKGDCVASEAGFLRLALLFYEAASEPELWPRFLKAYTEPASSEFAALQTHDFGRHRFTLASRFGLSTPFPQSYNDYYSKLNLWWTRGNALYREARVNFDEGLCPRVVLERPEFYNDYMSRRGAILQWARSLPASDLRLSSSRPCASPHTRRMTGKPLVACCRTGAAPGRILQDISLAGPDGELYSAREAANGDLW